MANEHLLAERRDGVLNLTLNQPDKLNALSDQMIAGLLDELGRAAHDADVRCVVVSGAGRGFCSGGDVSRMRERNEADGPGLTVEQRMASLRRAEEVSLMLHELPKPTIAALNGAAAGAGLSIALACDLRIAADTAEFWMPEVDLGSPGPRAPEQWLAAHVGAARAKEIIFTCRHFKPDELFGWGLLNRVVKKDQLMPVAMELAQSLAAKNPRAVAQAKSNINGFFLE